MNSSKGFSRLAFGSTCYLLFVIVYGAFVRATGSGAGCGSHWPLCNGEVVPLNPTLQTVIEYTHRITSGISLPLILILVLYGYKTFPKNSSVRKYVTLTFIFLIIEALLGAFLVKFEHVADNRSAYRAISMSLHLINTFLLMGAMITTWVGSLNWPKQPDPKNYQAYKPWLISMQLALVFIATTGAITALGDTLYPPNEFSKPLAMSMGLHQHFLIQLRVYHPFIAMSLGAVIIYCSYQISQMANSLAAENKIIQKLCKGIIHAIFFQLALGMLNIFLYAPTWLQLSHLFVAQLLWILMVALFTTIAFQPALKSKAT